MKAEAAVGSVSNLLLLLAALAQVTPFWVYGFLFNAIIVSAV